MYGIFRTITPSQSIHSLIYTHINDRDLIVCQRNTCLDFYSISNDQIPKLYKSFRGNCTFLKTFAYKPPTDSSTSLLILTIKYELILLQLINNEFVTKIVANLQENGVDRVDRDPRLLVDPEYNVILFYGYPRLLKCILLERENYFDFKNVVNLRMNYNHIVDLFFTNKKYNSITFTNKLRQSKSFNDNCILTLNGFSDSKNFLRPKRVPKSQNIIIENDVILLQIGLILLIQPENDSTRHIEIVRLYFELFNDKSHIIGYGYDPIDTLTIDEGVSNILPFPPQGDTSGILFIGSSIMGYKHLDDKMGLCHVYNGHLLAEIDSLCYKGIEKSSLGETHIYYASDITGQLYMFRITIKHDNDKYVINDKMRNLDTIIPLYTITPFSSLVLLNNDHIFVATRAGDSKILRLLDGKMTEIWKKPSLSPIVDADVIEGDCTDRVLAASGIGKSSNISIFTIGLFFDRIATIDIPRVSKLFVMAKSPDMALAVAVTYFNSYYINIADRAIGLIARGDKVIYAFNINDNLYQLTPNSLNLSTFEAPNTTISIWTCNEPIVHYLHTDNILFISSGYNISALVIKNTREITLNHVTTLPAPISALNISPNDKLILVATFTNVIFAVDYERGNVAKLCELSPKNHSGVSDLALVGRNSQRYIFIGLYDGTLLVYRHDVKLELSEPFISKKFGSNPLTFRCNSQHISLIGQYIHIVRFSQHTGRIVDFLPLEIQANDLSFISSNLLIISKSDALELGRLSDPNSLNVRRIPVGGTIDLIEFHQPSNSAIVAFPSSTLDSITPSKAYISIYNLSNGQIIFTYYLDSGYETSSISKITKGNDSILLGISTTDSDYLPKKGKIIACIYDDGVFKFKHSYNFDGDSATPGGVLQISANKNHVFAAVNNVLVVLVPIYIGRSWEGELSPIYTYDRCNMIIGIDLYDDLILLTDIVTGVKLLRFTSENGGRVEELARDVDSSWCNCARMIDSNHILICDIKGNITILRVMDDPINDEQCYILNKVAKFHLGESLNKIVIGKFGWYAMSATGGVYEFKFIDLKRFAPLHIFEASIIKVMDKLGIKTLSDYGNHSEYRSPGDDVCNIIDGDVLDILYDLNEDILLDIANESSNLGLKFNYGFNISHLLKWRILKYDEFFLDFDTLIV